MKFSSRQTRRLYIAGTVAFPIPFPAVGIISIEKAGVRHSSRGAEKGQLFVVVQEKPDRDHSVLRIIKIEDVSAIFFPGEFERVDDPKSRFKFSDTDRVEDFDKGEWFLNGDIDVATIAGGLNIDAKEFTSRDSIARGIVFVQEDRAVLTRTEVTSTAGAAGYPPCGSYCDPC